MHQFIWKQKSITWLSYNDSKSVYIFLGHPVQIVVAFNISIGL